MTSDEDAVSSAEVPEYLVDAAEPETEQEPDAPKVPRTGVLRFARMAGSSIAARDAAPWITDFLNAAYYRRAAGERAVDDMRLAFSVMVAQSMLHQLALGVADRAART